MTLAELAEAYGRPDIVKMDIEGAELAAFEGVGDALDATRALVIEVHSGCEQGTRAALDHLGFRVSELTDGPAARLVAQRRAPLAS